MNSRFSPSPDKMIKLYEFDGGIHPPENKDQSTQTPIQAVRLPKELILPISQHIGTGAKPRVSVGEQVLKGQKIAEAQGFVSSPIHAPTSGLITHIEERMIAHASGLSVTCIVIEPDHKETWVARQSLHQELGIDHNQPLPNDAIIQRVRESGIAGMGGAGFPTSVKLSAEQAQIDTLIINAAECEPYITADDMLMRERAETIVQGILLLEKLLLVDHCLVGVEDNKPQAIQALTQAAQDYPGIRVVTIPTKYPSGGEKQLIKILTGREVPSGQIPANIGIVCQNIGTCAAIAEAVHQGTPLISRITTVTGEAIQNKGNYDVLLGTPVEHLLDVAGYQPQKHERVIMGGPMMGFHLPSVQVPIVKTTNCLLAPTHKEMPLNDQAMACIRCGLCAEACPADLLPQQLYWFSKAKEFDKAEQHNLFDCIECGACSYVCPSQIPLVQYYRFAKGNIREERAAHAKAEQARERHENRMARQDREKAEREAKRQARAEAAAKAAEEKAAAAKKAAEQQPVPTAKEPEATAPIVDTSVLDKKIQVQLNRIEKAQNKLNDAKENGLDTQEALVAALTKQQAKLAELEQEREQLVASPQPDQQANTQVTDGVDNSQAIEALEKKILAQKNRLEKSQERYNMAQEQGLDTLDALQKGLDKQTEKLQTLEDELAKLHAQSAEKSTQPTTKAAVTSSKETATKADSDILKKKVQVQLSRIEKATNKLEDAKSQGLDTVPALEAALKKQQDKLAELEKELTNSEQPAASSSSSVENSAEAQANQQADAPKAPVAAVNPDILKKKVQVQLSRIEKATNKLEDAKNQGLETVPALEAALKKQQDKLLLLEKELEQALQQTQTTHDQGETS